MIKKPNNNVINNACEDDQRLDNMAREYVDIKKNVNQNKIIRTLLKYYKNEVFINILKKDKLISTNDVIGTNNCHISVCKSKNVMN